MYLKYEYGCMQWRKTLLFSTDVSGGPKLSHRVSVKQKFETFYYLLEPTVGIFEKNKFKNSRTKNG